MSFFLQSESRKVITRSSRNESHAYRKSKVRQLDGGVAVLRRVQQILRFQVSVRDVAVVEVFEGNADLVHDLGCLAFGEGAVLSVLNALEKFASLHATKKSLVRGQSTEVAALTIPSRPSGIWFRCTCFRRRQQC